MLQTFQTKSKVCLVLVTHSAMPLELMDSLYLPSLPLLSYLDGLKPYLSYLFSLEIFDVISVWLLLCYKSSICTVRVSITDPGMTLVHSSTDCLRSGRYKMVSEHMLTVGHDPRN